MKANNGFQIAAAAIDASGKVTRTGAHTWVDDTSATVEGVVAGTFQTEDNTAARDEDGHYDRIFWPSRPVETKDEERLCGILCSAIKARPSNGCTL